MESVRKKRKTTKDFLSIAKKLRVNKKGIDPIKARKALEKIYERK